jgi:hypothetical protein
MIGSRVGIDPLARSDFRQRRSLQGAGTAMLTEWRSLDVEFDDFSAAAASEDIEILSLPPRFAVWAAFIEGRAAWAGTAITAFTLSVGIVGDLTKYVLPLDVLAAGVFRLGVNPDVESLTAATSIRLAAVATGGNMTALTAGTARVSLLLGRVPSGE